MEPGNEERRIRVLNELRERQPGAILTGTVGKEPSGDASRTLPSGSVRWVLQPQQSLGVQRRRKAPEIMGKYKMGAICNQSARRKKKGVRRRVGWLTGFEL